MAHSAGNDHQVLTHPPALDVVAMLQGGAVHQAAGVAVALHEMVRNGAKCEEVPLHVLAQPHMLTRLHLHTPLGGGSQTHHAIQTCTPKQKAQAPPQTAYATCVSAHLPPASMDVKSLAPGMATGTSDRAMPVTASWKWSFRPQHHTCPSALRAHV